MKHVPLILCSFVFAFLFNHTTAFAQNELTFPAAKDNTLYEDANGALSNGSGEHLFVGKNNQGLIRRTLIAFSLSEIPPGATILGVTLSMHMSKTISAVQPVALHRVTGDWGEAGSDAAGGEGGGAAAQSGDATWLHRFFDSDLWTDAGGDFLPTPSAVQTVDSVGMYLWGSTPELVADVQNWVDNPQQNFGWILIGEESAFPTSKRFDSRENSLEQNRPVLTVTVASPTSVAEGPVAPEEFTLQQNFPNPFNPETLIAYSIPRSRGLQEVRLDIFNLLGQSVKTLVQGRLPAGVYQARWDGRDKRGRIVAGGVYFYRLQVGKTSRMRKMTFLK